MKDLLIIVAPQEYEHANHKHLWLLLARKLEATTDVVILNAAADLVYSARYRRFDKILDSVQHARRLAPNLWLTRPLTLVTPLRASELINRLNVYLVRRRLAGIVKQFPRSMTYVLYYNPKWVEVLSNLPKPLHKAFFLVDELNLLPSNGRPNPVMAARVRRACDESESVFVTSALLAEERLEFTTKLRLVGNGAILPGQDCEDGPEKIPKSVGFVGHFRDWIDFDLLEDLISSRPDLSFVFSGPVQAKVQAVFDTLLKRHANASYLGVWPKEKVHQLYQMIDVVIVPYRPNPFVAATRPIKIVESVFAGTPAVTVPVSGYEESSFIRFASSAAEFSQQIDYLIEKPIDHTSVDYHRFVEENSWDTIADKILEFMTRGEARS